MGIKPVYQKQGQELVNYSWVDVSEGTGIVRLYAGAIEDSTGKKYKLDKDTFRCSALTTSNANSDNGKYDIANVTNTEAKVLDLDFDTAAFNIPKDLRGTLTCNIAFGIHYKIVAVYFIVKVRKWNGTTETEIANAQSKSWAWDNTSAINKGFSSFTISCPKTHFKKGEQLRITVEVWGDSNVNDGAVVFAHDPKDTGFSTLAAGISTGATYTFNAGETVTEFLVPFDIT